MSSPTEAGVREVDSGRVPTMRLPSEKTHRVGDFGRVLREGLRERRDVAGGGCLEQRVHLVRHGARARTGGGRAS
jgi:hypothetical protein